jgi:hypothetical protein
MTRRVIFVAVAVALYLTSSGRCDARITRNWTWDDLYDESDFVGLVEPVANDAVGDKLTLPFDRGQLTLPGVNSRFRVQKAFKSPPGGLIYFLLHWHWESQSELVVLHFQETAESAEVTNGPDLINFPLPPVRYDKSTLKHGKVIAEIHMGDTTPLYLAFLKRRTDGRYEPTSGQIDAQESFRELHIAISSEPDA